MRICPVCKCMQSQGVPFIVSVLVIELGCSTSFTARMPRLANNSHAQLIAQASGGYPGLTGTVAHLIGPAQKVAPLLTSTHPHLRVLRIWNAG